MVLIIDTETEDEMSGWSNMPDVISQSNKETTSKSQSKNARSGSSGRRSSTNGEPNTAAAAAAFTATPKPGEAIVMENMSGIHLTR